MSLLVDFGLSGWEEKKSSAKIFCVQRYVPNGPVASRTFPISRLVYGEFKFYFHRHIPGGPINNNPNSHDLISSNYYAVKTERNLDLSLPVRCRDKPNRQHTLQYTHNTHTHHKHNSTNTTQHNTSTPFRVSLQNMHLVCVRATVCVCVCVYTQSLV